MSDKRITPTFSGEVQLAGWSESHNGGCKVTFWLQDSSDLDAFRAMTVRKGNTAGQRLACVLVEIGEDELPVQLPVASTTPGTDVVEKPKGGALAKLAGMWCESREFYEWIRPIYDRALGGNGKGWGDVTPQDDFGGSWQKWATHALYVLADIKSRVELDNDMAASERFHRLIRGPYMNHMTAVTA